MKPETKRAIELALLRQASRVWAQRGHAWLDQWLADDRTPGAAEGRRAVMSKRRIVKRIPPTQRPPRGQCGMRPSVAAYWPPPITPMDAPCDRPKGHTGLHTWALACVPPGVQSELLAISREVEQG